MPDKAMALLEMVGKLVPPSRFKDDREAGSAFRLALSRAIAAELDLRMGKPQDVTERLWEIRRKFLARYGITQPQLAGLAGKYDFLEKDDLARFDAFMRDAYEPEPEAVKPTAPTATSDAA